PSRPAVRNSSRQPAILPAGCAVSRASKSSDSPRNNLSHHGLLAPRAPAHLPARLHLPACRAGTQVQTFHPNLPNSRHRDLLRLIGCPDGTGCGGTATKGRHFNWYGSAAEILERLRDLPDDSGPEAIRSEFAY